MEISRTNLQQQAINFSTSVAKRSLQVASSVALPAIALYASQYTQTAEAGPVMHAACTAACWAASCAVTGPVCVSSLMACLQSCAFFEAFGP